MTYTHIDIDDTLLERAATILGTKQKKDTVEAALRAAVERARKDAAWQRFRALAETGVFSDAYDDLRRQRAEEQAMEMTA